MTKRMEATPLPRTPVKLQVYGIVASLLLLLLLNTVLGLSSGAKGSQRDGETMRLLQDLTRGVGRLETIAFRQALLLEQAVSTGDVGERRARFQETVEEGSKQMASLQALLKKAQATIANLESTKDGQRLSQIFTASEKGLRDQAEMGAQILDLAQRRDVAQGRKVLEELTQHHNAMIKSLDMAQATAGTLSGALTGAFAQGKSGKIRLLAWGLVVLGLILGGGATWWVLVRHERDLADLLAGRPAGVAAREPTREACPGVASGRGLAIGGGESIAEIEAGLVRLEGLGEPLHNLASALAAHVQEMTEGADKAIYDAREMRTNMTTINAWAEESNQHMHVISQSADESSANMQSINKASEDANTALKMVAESSEQASVSMNSVRDAAERTNRNLNEVARSVEELNLSLMEVRRQCEAADRESGQASHNAQNNSEVMANLAKAAQEIGKVIELINEIADQTNMLALNASIEAAGAGDAGKGFAVVANEVKELARQTTDAIRLVGDSVDEIQEKTSEATKAAHEMARNIERISQSNREILHTVDSQSNNIQAVARSMEAVALENSEVTRLVAESSGGISEMSRNVNEISEGIAEVTRNVTEATEGIHRMATGVAEIARGNIENSQNVADAASSTTGVISSMELVNETAGKIGEMGTGIATLAEGLDREVHEVRRILDALRG
ncbi:MAG: methyl-accepting chemotaxis protein [Magnetococcales bacterium]|nr:methyl-accepting chemotaxis protein [Magnetococcales bacterium]